MKELSIKEKAKCYDKAFERAKEKYTTCYSPALLEYIFPKLKENKDKEIRKDIIRNLERYIKCMKDRYDTPSAKDFVKEIEKQIVWLEKQGEQKPAWSEEDERMCQETIDWFEKKCFPYALENDNPARESINWLKSLKDRYTWKPSDEQLKILNEVLNFAANHESPYWNDYIFGTLNNLIRQLKKLKS